MTSHKKDAVGNKPARSNLPKLTSETIKAKTKSGDTPLHRAAKNGQFNLIPNQLLNIDLIKIQNVYGDTCLHIAARHGTLHQIPLSFLTKETITISSKSGETCLHAAAKSGTLDQIPQHLLTAETLKIPQGTWITGSGYKAQGDTVFHSAAFHGHFDQIPNKFYTLEFLKIEAGGHRVTVLECLLMKKSLHVIPNNALFLDYRNSQGRTLREQIQAIGEHEAYVAKVRKEPATEKQKAKLRWFGYSAAVEMTKGEASDAIDKCIRQNPEKERQYYNRPATDNQLAQLRAYAAVDKDLDEMIHESQEENGDLTYGEAKDLLQIGERGAERREIDCFMNEAAGRSTSRRSP